MNVVIYDNSVVIFPQEGRGFGFGDGRKEAENNKSLIHVSYAKQALNESFKRLFKYINCGAEGRTCQKNNKNNKLLKLKRVFSTLNEFLYSLGCIVAYYRIFHIIIVKIDNSHWPLSA